MSEEFVIVWRHVEGAALQTYANPDKTPRVFDNAGATEAEGALWVDADALTVLLEQRDPFANVLVDRQSARDLLGWAV